MRKVNIYFYVIGFLLFFHQGIAQNVSISGQITDAISGEALPGAIIRTSDGAQGSVADLEGNFTIMLLPGAYVLEVSFIGHKHQIVPIEVNGAVQGLNVALEEDVLGLEELVITGQGINTEKRRLSTTVETISAKEIESVPVGRIDQLLQSRIPNLQTRLASGQPGATSITRSRGVVSALVNSTPIIYIDGVRVDNLNTTGALSISTRSSANGGQTQSTATSALAERPVENIERIECVTGGAATTLYGSDAANGVIQIFTKKGGTGRTNAFVEVQLGVDVPTKDFLFFDRTADLLHQNGFRQLYRVGVNGGDNKNGYSITGSMAHNEGINIHDQNENRTYNIRTGFRSQLSDKFSYNGSFGFVHNTFSRTRDGNDGGYVGLWFSEAGASLFTPNSGFWETNNLNELSSQEFDRMREWVSTAERLQDFQTTVRRFQMSNNLQYQPTKSLSARATVGIDYRVQNETGIFTNEYLIHTGEQPEGTDDQGSISNFERKFLGLTLELAAQHQAEVGDFSFVSTMGGQLFRNEDDQIFYRGENVQEGSGTVSDAAVTTSDDFALEIANYGIYLQENIGFMSKYFLEFGIRGDQNSAFGDDIGIQWYPKVGGSYILSDEPFFANLIPENIVSYFKLRGNLGFAGNLPQPFSQERTVQFNGFLGEQSATFGQPGNEDLTAERSRTFEIGADIGLVGERITLGVNYYNTRTQDALFFVRSLPSAGETQTQVRNVGEIENKGLEVFSTIILVQNQTWDLRVNFAVNTLENKVLDAGGSPAFPINGFSGRTIQTVVEEGQPVGFLRGNKGTFGENGVLQETEAQSFLGSTIPDFFGNVGLNLRWKSLNLFANADYQQGAFAHSFDRQFRFFYGVDNEGIPQAEIDARGRDNWLNFTDQFVEETDFFRVRQIGLTYDFSQEMLGDLFRGITLGFTVFNPINISSSSFDPEATQSGGLQGQNTATTGGISYGTASAPRQYISTIKFRF